MNPRVALNVFADEQLRRIKALPIHQSRVLIAPPIRGAHRMDAAWLPSETGMRAVPEHRRSTALHRAHFFRVRQLALTFGATKNRQ